jgi:hypothetical protein
MAEQRRSTTGDRAPRRTPAPRRAPAPRRPAGRRRARWLVPLLAVAAGAVLVGPQLTPALVELTAASEPVAAAAVDPAPTPTANPTPTLAAAQGVSTLDDVASASSLASVAAGGGLAVPQPPRPGRITIMPNAAVGTPPTYAPRPDTCGAYSVPRRMVPGVVAGTGAATLDWMSDDRAEVLGYRVQAVSQQLVGGRQPDPVVQSVAQPGGCVPVRVTVTGLTSGVPYVFWLEEQVTSVSTGVTRLVQVGTSGAVVIG